MTKKNNMPTKSAAAKSQANAKSSKVVAKSAKAPPSTKSKPKASPAPTKPQPEAKESSTVARPAAKPTKPAPSKAPAPAGARPSAPPAHPQRAMPAAGKPSDARVSAPVAQKPAAPARPAASPAATAPPANAAAAAAGARKQVTMRHGFKTNELIVYPAHGVGRIIGIEEQEIAGMSLELFVIEFEKDKMTLRVPTGKLASVGMRKLADEGIVKKSLDTLKGRARIKRTMWSRRAQEYEAKINSGDLVAIAEVVRDLYRSEAQPEQSYSERQLYEAALDRMARELAAVDRSDERSAMQRITEVLAKSARGRRAAEELATDDVDATADGEVKAA
ncbi:MAG: CarD family transcriptional regulator [Hyphomicrobiaceae bacterium]|nr:CarD family transcriptional regulator [Hyphomicrobiaceae bacterium]